MDIEINAEHYIRTANKVNFSKVLLDVAKIVSNMNYFVVQNNQELPNKPENSNKNEMEEEEEFDGLKRSKPSSSKGDDKIESLETPLRKIHGESYIVNPTM